MTKLTFDTMQLNDLEEVIRLEKRNYPIAWSQGVMRDCIKAGYQCITLKRADEIISYAFLMVSLDESHLLNMCVDKNYQGQGLGKKVLKYLENVSIYNHAKQFLLEVRESNQVAKNLYQSFGFKQIGIRKNYYRCIKGRENAIVMSKKI